MAWQLMKPAGPSHKHMTWELRSHLHIILRLGPDNDMECLNAMRLQTLYILSLCSWRPIPKPGLMFNLLLCWLNLLDNNESKDNAHEVGVMRSQPGLHTQRSSLGGTDVQIMCKYIYLFIYKRNGSLAKECKLRLVLCRWLGS